MQGFHRKTKQTFNEPAHAHFLTFSCVNRWPLLSRDSTRQWVIDELNAARSKHGMDLLAYVIMPEHVHALVFPRRDAYQIERFLYDVKRPVSWKAKQFLIDHGEIEWLNRLTVKKGSREVFRFWQQGGGYDNNIFRDRTLRAVIDYVHANPVRRGLVERTADWVWSSARYWAGERDVPIQMDALPT